MADRDRIGARVAALRKTRGWTARELARRARVSYSLLAKVETGSIPASPAFTGAVARALRVDVSRVTGQPYEEPGNAAALQATVEPLRRALLVYDLPPLGDVQPRQVGELRADVVAVSGLAARRVICSSASGCPACSMNCRPRSRRRVCRSGRCCTRCWPRRTAVCPRSRTSLGTPICGRWR